VTPSDEGSIDYTNENNVDEEEILLVDPLGA
jgi:hypothetical protein